MKEFYVTEIRFITEDHTYVSHAEHTAKKGTIIAVGEDGWYIYSPPFSKEFAEDKVNWPKKEKGKIRLFRDYWKYLLDPAVPESKASSHDNAYKNAFYKVIV